MVGVCFWVSYMVLLSSSMSFAKSMCVQDCRCLDTYIDCDSLRLKVVPKHIPQWTHRLEINRNNLTQIEALTFQNLKNLRVLSLKRNEIDTLKDGAFYGLKRIEKLMLDKNHINVITKGWLYGLESLKELSLSHNRISQIHDDAWEFCSTLTNLDLSFNKLNSIKEYTFKSLSSLQKLVLNNNDIAIIMDHAFEQLPKLRILHFNYNKISWTIEDAKGVFQGLGELVKFHLIGNNIKSINSDAFLGLKNVSLINLDRNNITSIHNNTFSKVPALKFPKVITMWFSFRPDEVLKPRLTEEPALEIMALKGESVTLNCKARSNSNSNLTFVWKKDNVELVNSNVIVNSNLDQDGKSVETVSELKLFSVEHSHAGKYQCVVSNSYGITYSQQSTISVLVYPTFIKTPKNVEVEAGQTVKLECAATGEPPPEVAWHKDGGNDFPAARERRMHVLLGDDVFFIRDARPSDAGVYSCTAHNTAGIASANASLKVLQRPQLIHGPEDRELPAGEPIVLQCMAQGVPKPTVTWVKDGELIMATERHFFIAENQLIIIVDSVHNDSGIYECHLNNSQGEEVGRSRVVVKPSVLDTSNMMGIIIITVVCCAVFTSIVWVAIIYQTRKSGTPKEPVTFPGTELTELHVDCASERSSCKDSGTGDSAKRSSDDLAEFSILLHCARSDHDRGIQVDSVETGD
ncbi:hypothetical protein HUJ05_002670 [Dendroctonus ponderosae]|nr:hypothetical protein HUJ05_002670 [Dendroctonus ponderosae]